MFAQDVLQKGEVLASVRDENGEIRVNLGDSTTGEGEVLGAALWCADGFFGRPLDADSDGSCQVLYHCEGNQQRAIATKDNRFIDAYAELEPGDRAIVTDGPTRLFMKRATNQISLYTENDEDPAQPHILDLNGATKNFIVSTSDGTNVGQLTIGPTEATLCCGGALIQLKDGTVNIFADFIGLYAGKGSLSTVGGVVPPPGSNGIIFGTSGVAGVPSLNWTIAP
jgi:hypothetical protein